MRAHVATVRRGVAEQQVGCSTHRTSRQQPTTTVAPSTRHASVRSRSRGGTSRSSSLGNTVGGDHRDASSDTPSEPTAIAASRGPDPRVRVTGSTDGSVVDPSRRKRRAADESESEGPASSPGPLCAPRHLPHREWVVQGPSLPATRVGRRGVLVGSRAMSSTRSSDIGPSLELHVFDSHRPQLWNITSSPAIFIRISTIPCLAHRLHCISIVPPLVRVPVSTRTARVIEMSTVRANFLEDDRRMSGDDSRDEEPRSPLVRACAGDLSWRGGARREQVEAGVEQDRTGEVTASGPPGSPTTRPRARAARAAGPAPGSTRRGRGRRRPADEHRRAAPKRRRAAPAAADPGTAAPRPPARTPPPPPHRATWAPVPECSSARTTSWCGSLPGCATRAGRSSRGRRPGARRRRRARASRTADRESEVGAELPRPRVTHERPQQHDREHGAAGGDRPAMSIASAPVVPGVAPGDDRRRCRSRSGRRSWRATPTRSRRGPTGSAPARPRAAAVTVRRAYGHAGEHAEDRPDVRDLDRGGVGPGRSMVSGPPPRRTSPSRAATTEEHPSAVSTQPPERPPTRPDRPRRPGTPGPAPKPWSRWVPSS